MKNPSVQGKEWVIKNYDNNLLELISNKYDLDFFIAKLLSIKGFKEHEVESFLEPKIKNYLPNPFHFKDCDEGVNIIYKHINNNSKITINSNMNITMNSGSDIVIYRVIVRYSMLQFNIFIL